MSAAVSAVIVGMVFALIGWAILDLPVREMIGFSILLAGANSISRGLLRIIGVTS